MLNWIIKASFKIWLNSKKGDSKEFLYEFEYEYMIPKWGKKRLTVLTQMVFTQ